MPSVIKYPTSDEATVGTWTKSAGASYFGCVDETPASDVDYITCTALAGGRGRQTFGFAAFAIPAGSAQIQVHVYNRDRDASIAGSNVGGALKVNGTYYDAAGRDPTTAYVNYVDSWATNPNTGLAWTVDDINGAGANPLQAFGVTTNDTTPNVSCSQCYIEVVYDIVRQLTQEVVESDVNQTDRQRRLSQEVVESDVNQIDRQRRLMQLVIEVDGDNWGFVTGRILGAQFV
jgi:hypothetical protein